MFETKEYIYLILTTFCYIKAVALMKCYSPFTDVNPAFKPDSDYLFMCFTHSSSAIGAHILAYGIHLAVKSSTSSNPKSGSYFTRKKHYFPILTNLN